MTRPAGGATSAAAQAVGRFEQLDMPLSTTPEQRMDQMRAFRDEAAARPETLALAKAILHDRCVEKLECPRTARGALQALLSALPDLVEYTPDKPGKEVIQSVFATLQPSKGTALSPLTKKNKGRGDCKDLSTLYAALAKALGFDSAFLWFDQPQAPINHVALQVNIPGEGWQIVETTIPGALVGEDPYTAIRNHGFGDRVGRTTAHALCEECEAKAAGCPGSPLGDYGASPSGLALYDPAGDAAPPRSASPTPTADERARASAAVRIPQPVWPGLPAGTRLFVVRATEHSTFRPFSPPANLIEDRLRVAGNWRNPAADHWIGAPRITRTSGSVFALGGGSGFDTTVAALWALGSRTEEQAIADLAVLLARVRDALGQIEHSSWGDVVVAPYNPALNGDLAGWAGGAAAVTQTRDEFPVLTADPNENPVGPTTDGTHPGSPLPTFRGTTDLLDALKWVVVPVVAVGGLVAARPYFEALFGGKSAKPARPNPRRRTR